MDPNLALSGFINLALSGFIGALQEGDNETADEYWEALDVWLRSGGSEPDWQPHERRLFTNYRKEDATG